MIKYHGRGGFGAVVATALAVAALACTTFTRAQESAPAAASQQSGPRPEIDAPEYDFGNAVAGSIVKHTFLFRNRGDQTLEITNIHPACGCTTVGTYPRRIEPGQSVSIPVELNVPRKAGPVRKTLAVHCSMKNQPTTTLVLKGTVFNDVAQYDIAQYADLVTKLQIRLKEASDRIQQQNEVIQKLATESGIPFAVVTSVVTGADNNSSTNFVLVQRLNQQQSGGGVSKSSSGP